MRQDNRYTAYELLIWGGKCRVGLQACSSVLYHPPHNSSEATRAAESQDKLKPHTYTGKKGGLLHRNVGTHAPLCPSIARKHSVS